MLSAMLVLWPELSENLPGKPQQGHFHFLAFSFLTLDSILCVKTKAVCVYVYMHVLTNSHVGLLLWHRVPFLYQAEEKRRSVSIF